MKYFYMLDADQLIGEMTSLSQTLYSRELGIDKIRREIDNCILDNGDFDGSALSALWFPVDKYDVFISHSHQDLNKVYKLALNLIRAKKKVFVDSFLWGYHEELISKIKSKINYFTRENEYNIEKSINLLLANALSNAIYNSENFLFINTENSLIRNDQNIINKINEDLGSNLWKNSDEKTYSPWIMHELTLSRIIHDCQSVNMNESVVGAESYTAQASVQLPAEIKHLQKITLSSLRSRIKF
ncbi:hypothetical protein KWH78_08025 [Morganella morganii]|uniref:hypothetical protein n=1 Tax=Morganella morganii TaxID=582 RepID=UPI0021D120C0|nr:hypothetical protein [Morganella morganii]MCU6211056.1 hypothetical protein [Morganella morganii]